MFSPKIGQKIKKNSPFCNINGSDPSQQTESVSSSNAANRMREKLAALEDLNELLEEPVEEQVSSIFFY